MLEYIVTNWISLIITSIISIIIGFGIWFFTDKIHRCLFNIKFVILKSYENTTVNDRTSSEIKYGIYTLLKNNRSIILPQTHISLCFLNISPKKYLKLHNKLDIEDRLKEMIYSPDDIFIKKYNLCQCEKIDAYSECLIKIDRSKIPNNVDKNSYIYLYDKQTGKIIKFFKFSFSFSFSFKKLYENILSYFLEDIPRTMIKTAYCKII